MVGNCSKILSDSVVISLVEPTTLSYKDITYEVSTLEKRYVANFLIDILYDVCLQISEENARQTEVEAVKTVARKKAQKLLEDLLGGGL